MTPYSGKDGEQNGSETRICRCSAGQKKFETEEFNMSKKLVAYFSASGVTKKYAQKLAESADADLYEIKPTVPYTNADLDWRDQNSRSTIEMKNPDSRPKIAAKCAEMDKYDTVFLGFPIWWYVAPTIIDTFLESYDFSGKTIVLFATSGGSGIEASERSLRAAYPQIDWKKGRLLNSFPDKARIEQWLSGTQE